MEHDDAVVIRKGMDDIRIHLHLQDNLLVLGREHPEVVGLAPVAFDSAQSFFVLLALGAGTFVETSNLTRLEVLVGVLLSSLEPKTASTFAAVAFRTFFHAALLSELHALSNAKRSLIMGRVR